MNRVRDTKMSHVNYTKEDYNYMAIKRRNAFCKIAEALGKNHPITKMMGTLAWGRHNFEQGPQGNLRTAIREMSALDGMFTILNIWARDNDTKAQQIMLGIYSMSFEEDPRKVKK